ncbi:MAG: alpha/beta hydrolase [Halothiobacillaceae bacterium]
MPIPTPEQSPHAPFATAWRPARRQALLAALILTLPMPLVAEQADPEDDWAAFDAWAEQIEQAQNVSLGELRFVDPPEQAVHHHRNHIRLDAESIETGWADMRQCHDHLDEIGRAQVLYREGRIRDIRVTESRGIGKAYPEGHSVQLENVQENATLCVEARTLAIEPLPDTGDGNLRYVLRSGPFMRKFLDGYYPMQVTLTVDWPAELLDFDGIDPVATEGFSVESREGQVQVNTHFEGMLRTAMTFRAPKNAGRSD